jgi:hypothetical protein
MYSVVKIGFEVDDASNYALSHSEISSNPSIPSTKYLPENVGEVLLIREFPNNSAMRLTIITKIA